MKKLVIVGGGYGGLNIAKKLILDRFPDDILIILVDRMPFQGLKTEYYALASGTISESDIRVQYPVDPRLIIKNGNVTDIDPELQLVYFHEDEPIHYDWLVIGLGCVDNYHGIEGAEQFSQSIQSLPQTRKTYQALNDITSNGQVTIIGGGLSGVELAAELRESRKDLKIRIMDRGDSVLSAFPKKLREFVRDWFIENGVELIPNADINRLENGAIYNHNRPVYTDIAVWTAGIKPHPIVEKMNVKKDPSGRVVLNEYHQIPELPHVFVVGDCASLPFSPSAQAAEAQGEQIAQVLLAFWQDRTPELGNIKLKGVLGSLGKKTGFGMMGPRTVMLGRVPRLLKSGVLWMSKRHSG